MQQLPLDAEIRALQTSSGGLERATSAQTVHVAGEQRRNQPTGNGGARLVWRWWKMTRRGDSALGGTCRRDKTPTRKNKLTSQAKGLKNNSKWKQWTCIIIAMLHPS